MSVPIIEIDIRWNDEYDLTRPRFQKLVRGWLLAGQVAAVWLGTPCSSFSRARDRPGGPPPLRSNACVLGLPGLSDKDALKVQLGNKLMRFSVSVLILCRRLVIPAVMENPATSRLWITPGVKYVACLSGARMFQTDYCQWGVPWRKRTKFLGLHIDLSPIERQCSGVPGWSSGYPGQVVCARSLKPHIVLCGVDANNVFRTLIAEPYPPTLCTGLVKCFASAIAARDINGWSLTMR